MKSADTRIAALRGAFEDLGIDALIVPTQDPHFSEYPPAHHRARAYLSGFLGSAGTLVVTKAQAGLWTDSRYFLEAEDALASTSIDLHRLETPGVLDWPTWLGTTLRTGDAVGIDGRLLSLYDESRLLGILEPRGIALRTLTDPLAKIWTDRTPMAAANVAIHEAPFPGEPARKKIADLRKAIERRGAEAHLICTLDDIAWLLNLRGSSVEYNPVFVAYLLLTSSEATLFVDLSDSSTDVAVHLAEAGVSARSYGDLDGALAAVDGPILLDPNVTSVAVRNSLGTNVSVIESAQPTLLMKACKHPSEVEHVRDAMRRDGVAMVRFLKWLEERVGGGHDVSEIDASKHLSTIRGSMERFVSDAFRTISAVDRHAAIPHYSVTPESSLPIRKPVVYLVDSGGQYVDGTTDITRTMAFGDVSATVAEDFALVLRGMIALASLRFPRGWAGRDLDAVARLAMWREGRNFGHGTGHGVGYYLNVHEGPQRIAPTASDTPLEPGMIVSDEPGIYRAGEYGIRIENLLVVQEDEVTEFAEFLSFETLTLCPIDRSLIRHDLYNAEELAWIDAYHRRVREELTPFLSDAERRWLRDATKPFATGEE